jgi:hypothetical protein
VNCRYMAWVTTRHAQLFALRSAVLDARGVRSKVRYLVTVLRECYNTKTQCITAEMSYYLSNSAKAASPNQHLNELAGAVRRHWCVESNNWVRVRAPNQAHILSLLRSLGLVIVRKTQTKNLQAMLERLSQVPSELEGLLKRINFLQESRESGGLVPCQVS